MSQFRYGVSAAIVMATLGLAAAQQKPQAPVFKAGVNAVRVDVIVTDRQGNAVLDLKQDDFEVLEDGKPQAIDLFRLVHSDGNPAPGSEAVREIRSPADEQVEAARDEVRLFVIFLDDYHVRLQNGLRVKDMLIAFIRKELGPLDMVALMYPLTPVSGLAFTRDRELLVQEIRQFEGRKYNYAVRNAFEQQYVFASPQVIETIRNEVTLTALGGLPVKLGALREGRKAVIFVSEGFFGVLPAQMRSEFGGAAPTQAVDPRTEDRARLQADRDIEERLREVGDAANRNNTAIYALDPRGLAVGEFDLMSNAVSQSEGMNILRDSQSTLQTLAVNTDGRAIINQNDIGAALKQVVKDTSAYYLVGYNSLLTAPDGKFHRIDVRLKRQGLQVRSRKGYWAPTKEEAAAAAAPPKARPPADVEKALSAVETKPGDTTVAAWIGTSRGADGRTRVSYVWEPLPPVPGETKPEPVRVTVMAIAPGGETLFKGRAPEDAPGAAGAQGAAGQAAAGGAAAPPSVPALRAASRVSFEVRPGKLQLRTTVETAAGKAIDDVRQDLVIPDYSEQKTALSTPAVYCARTPREFQALSRDPDPTPTANRQFRRTDRLLLRFAAYAAQSAAPQVTVRLLARGGQKMSDLAPKAPEGDAGYYQVDLPLAGLSPGDYLLEVRVGGDGADVTQLIAFHVSS